MSLVAVWALVPAGIVLPASILESPAFTAFATFVGFNTVVYLGLTLSRLIPLPAPIHPDAVRRMLGRTNEESDMTAPSTLVRVEDESAAQSATTDIARAFASLGGATLIVGVILVFATTADPNDELAAIAFGVACLVVSQLIARRRARPLLASWLWAFAVTALVALVLANAAVLDGDPILIGYAVVLMAAYGAVVVSTPAFAASALVMLGFFIVAAVTPQVPIDGTWIPVATAALACGVVLMRTRRRSMALLAEIDALSERIGSTDPLTGLLTRNGLGTLAAQLVGTARRMDEPICLMLVNIDRTREANEIYGRRYGDDVVRTVADAIRGSVRDGDLVARWSGDEFLVLGIGGRPDVEQLARRIEQRASASGVALGKWPITVSCGTASGKPDASLDALADDAALDLRRFRAAREEETAR